MRSKRRKRMTTNHALLDYSIQKPEPIYDPAYQKELLVIRESPDTLNELMKANRSLLDYITAYGVNRQVGNAAANNQIITRMMQALDTANINTSEFTSFWECCDVSYSVYRKLGTAEKRQFLERITQEYLARRHALYQAHGYTFTTLQVKADSFAHKRTGDQGSAKAVGILERNGFVPFSSVPTRGSSTPLSYLLPDKGDEKAFRTILRDRAISFPWSRREKGKLPDYALLIRSTTVIVEHKHMKELGGGQDKQILEISHFLQQSDESTIYVSFLDGILFNQLFSAVATGKVALQQKEIKEALTQYPRSYFVNTAGFERLVRELADIK